VESFSLAESVNNILYRLFLARHSSAKTRAICCLVIIVIIVFLGGGGIRSLGANNAGACASVSLPANLFRSNYISMALAPLQSAVI